MTPKKTKRDDPNWQETYQDTLSTPKEAVSHIRPGQRVFIGTGCAQPQGLVRALTDESARLADTEITHLLTIGQAPYAHKTLARHFRINSFFVADNVRDIIQEGLGDYTPVFLSDIPNLFKSGRLPLDAALIMVSPPDEKGMCSLGISVDIVKAAAENASLVIAEVNSKMPRTLGDSFINVHDIDFLVPSDEPLIEVVPSVPDDATRQIGEYVAALVEDGSTLELGIGRIPQAVIEFLGDKEDLGIHTEMFTDKIMDLIENGTITGLRKTIDQGKIVASFCLGTKKLYDYIDNNPVFSFQPTEYVNDPLVIGRQYRQVAINVALEVDLTGQVCADSIGTKFYSGIGGQVDFNRGAARSHGGKAIIALPSTAKQGTISRIVSRLSSGAGVVTTRGDVHYVVTEYGVAYLHGKSVQERAMALISIAHPDFREALLKDAISAKYVRREMVDVESRISIGPKKLRANLVLEDGTQVNFRSIHPTDAKAMQAFFYNLSEESIYYRFMSHLKTLSQQQLQQFVYIDHRQEVSIVGTIPEAHGEEIIAVGRYILNPKTNRAEVAFITHDAWQHRGIAAFLYNYLVKIARSNGIAGFTAEVMHDNKGMRSVFDKSDMKMKTTWDHELFSYVMDFE